MIVIGLTGGIGMGKSTTAKIFASKGVPVWDADACVHRLYDGGAAVKPLASLFPHSVVEDRVDREALKRIISKDASALKKIETVVHPLVAKDRKAFIENASSPTAVLDIPLLFESGAESEVDVVVVVSVPEDIQKARVLARGTMTATQFEAIKKKQVSDAEKRARADYVIEALTLQSVEHQVDHILEKLGHA